VVVVAGKIGQKALAMLMKTMTGWAVLMIMILTTIAIVMIAQRRKLLRPLYTSSTLIGKMTVFV
jgi:hypothetical protein